MTFEDINTSLIADSIKKGVAIIPTPEKLKAKFGQKNIYKWQEYKYFKPKPTINVYFEENEQKESLLDQLFEIIRSKL